ncbi:hypothetical protein GCM10007190_16480 [Macrococcus hajekii]|nr:hypothetical protein GCM10007190_16480 [Macrococcus hajekii]
MEDRIHKELLETFKRQSPMNISEETLPLLRGCYEKINSALYRCRYYSARIYD